MARSTLKSWPNKCRKKFEFSGGQLATFILKNVCVFRVDHNYLHLFPQYWKPCMPLLLLAPLSYLRSRILFVLFRFTGFWYERIYLWMKKDLFCKKYWIEVCGNAWRVALQPLFFEETLHIKQKNISTDSSSTREVNLISFTALLGIFHFVFQIIRDDFLRIFTKLIYCLLFCFDYFSFHLYFLCAFFYRSGSQKSVWLLCRGKKVELSVYCIKFFLLSATNVILIRNSYLHKFLLINNDSIVIKW